MRKDLDASDLDVVEHLGKHPLATVKALAEAGQVHRNTIPRRLDQLKHLFKGYVLDLAATGVNVLAFSDFQIEQGCHDEVAKQLRARTEVLTIHELAGTSDIRCTLVAGSNKELWEKIREIRTEITGISRAQTVVALAPQVPFEDLPDRILAVIRTRIATGARQKESTDTKGE